MENDGYSCKALEAQRKAILHHYQRIIDKRNSIAEHGAIRDWEEKSNQITFRVIGEEIDQYDRYLLLDINAFLKLNYYSSVFFCIIFIG